MKLRWAYTNIGVFYKHRRWAENWFKEVAEELGDNVTRMIIDANELIIDTVDMHIIGMYPFESCCGQRFDKVILEPDVCENYDIMNVIVKPMVLNPIVVDWSDENEIKEDKL